MKHTGIVYKVSLITSEERMASILEHFYEKCELLRGEELKRAAMLGKFAM